MSEKFYVGEVVIVVRSDGTKREGTVVAGPALLGYSNAPQQRNYLAFGYYVDGCECGSKICVVHGGKHFAYPHQLRKKRPPEQPASWSEIERICGWRPQGVSA